MAILPRKQVFNKNQSLLIEILYPQIVRKLETIWVNQVSQSYFILCSAIGGNNVWQSTTGGRYHTYIFNS